MFLITYMTGVVKSWVYWPIIAGTMFLCKYKKQKARFEARHPGQVAMAWPLSRQVRFVTNIIHKIVVNFHCHLMYQVYRRAWLTTVVGYGSIGGVLVGRMSSMTVVV